MATAIIGMVSKLVIFGINMFIRKQARRDALKKSFEAFMVQSGYDTEKSSALHEESNRLKDEETWLKEKN
jgi:hypothetical protein